MDESIKAIPTTISSSRTAAQRARNLIIYQYQQVHQ